jgi:hypothetical protein
MESNPSRKFTKEEGDAFVAAVVPILRAQILNHFDESPNDDSPFGHERELARRISVTTEMRDRRQRRHSREELLRMHYGEGKRHPDDGYLPIDKWNETE